MLHIIPFDPKADTETDAAERFRDAMHDWEQLKPVLDDKIELLRPDLDGLMRRKCGPWQRRARERLGVRDG